MGWNYSSILKLQQLHHYLSLDAPRSLVMDTQFHPILYIGCNCLSMLWLDVSERGAWPHMITSWHGNAFSDIHGHHRQLDCLFCNLFRLTTKKSSKPCTSGVLWGESTFRVVMQKAFPCHDVISGIQETARQVNPFVRNILINTWWNSAGKPE